MPGAGLGPVVRSEPSLDSASNQNGAPNDTAKAVTAQPTSLSQKSYPCGVADFDHVQQGPQAPAAGSHVLG